MIRLGARQSEGLMSDLKQGDCRHCDGCGQIANTDDGEAWTFWEELPAPSNIAVQMGLVKPIPCPECDGTGKARDT